MDRNMNHVGGNLKYKRYFIELCDSFSGGIKEFQG